MEPLDVIVRAFRGRPLHRVAILGSDRLVYVASPERLAEIQNGNSEPTGFPKEDVFAFEPTAYAELCAEWERTGVTDSTLWERLCRVPNPPSE